MTGGPIANAGPGNETFVISDFTRLLRGKTGGALSCVLGITLLGPALQAQTSDESSPAVQAQRDEQINQLQKRLEEMQGELDALKKANAIHRAEQHYSTSKASTPPPVPQATTEIPAELTDPNSPHSEPFAFADFTWLNGNARTKDTPYATQFFTPEIRADVNYTYDFRHPQDDTISGSR